MEQEIAEKFKMLYRNVLGYAISRTGNTDAAHDLVMEVYTKIFANFRESGDLPEQLEFYTIRAIRNKHIDHIRASQRIDYINDIDGYLEPVDETLPSDPLIRRRINRAFENLGEICQQTLKLIEEGWKYQQIHELTDMPVNTVASTVFRCRKKFRENLYGAEPTNGQV